MLGVKCCAVQVLDKMEDVRFVMLGMHLPDITK
jgi:hypothetical protein